MEDYRKKQLDFICNMKGVKDISQIPMQRFNDKSKICFRGVHGSVRYMLGKAKTEHETEEYVNRVLNSSLPYENELQ